MEFSQFSILFSVFFLSSALLRPPSDNEKVITVPLVQLGDNIYYAFLQIANSPEPFSVLFDTISQDLLLFSKKNQTNNTSFLELPKVSNAKESWTYSPFEEDSTQTDLINFFTEGHIGFVNISLEGINVTNQICINILSDSKVFLQNNIFDGIIGIGPRNKTLGEFNTVLSNMVEQGLISKPIVSFYLNRFSMKNEVIFGGLKPHVYKGSLKHIPNINKYQWMVKMDRIEIVGGKFNFRKENCSAIVSVGNHYILGPEDEIARLNNVIGAIPINSGKDYIINSRLLKFMPTINIILSGNKFTLKPFDYIRDFQYLEKTISETIFKPIEKGMKNWILGRTFIQKYFTQFDLETNTVGFAKRA